MRPRLPEALLLVIFGALALLFASRPIWNIDIFWHLAAGEYILTHGELPTRDIFSAITPERSWVTFQWGYEVLVHVAELIGGLSAVRVLHTVVIIGALGGFWWCARRRLSMGPWVSIALTLLLLVLFGDRIRARPHVFNLLGWVIALPWLVKGPIALTRRAYIGVAILMACWANLHAGGALLFLIAAATLPAGAMLGALMKEGDAKESVRRSMTWYACALIPALASPLFIRGNLQALTTFADHEGVIGEWQPSWYFLTFVTGERLGSSGLSHALCALAPSLLALLLLLCVWQSSKKRTHKAPMEAWRALLVLALVVLGHRSVRFVYVAAFGLLALAPYLGAFKPQHHRWRQASLALAISMLGFASYGFNIGAQSGSIAAAAEQAFAGPDIDTRRYPVAAADFLSSTGFEGHIFCQTNWGGYLRWRLGPKVRVIADGRANFSAEVAEDLAYVYERRNLEEPDAGARREAIYSRYDVDLIVHQHPVWPENYAPNPKEFLRIFSDARGALWLRNTARGSAYLDTLKRSETKP